MKRTIQILAVMLAGMMLLTGCDKVKELLTPPEPTPQKKSSGGMGPVPELQIFGVTEEEGVALRDYLEVRGLLQQAQDYVVVINTQLVRKGEVLRMDVEKSRYRVEVESIDEMRVILKASKEGD